MTRADARARAGRQASDGASASDRYVYPAPGQVVRWTALGFPVTAPVPLSAEDAYWHACSGTPYVPRRYFVPFERP
jgi:hypothetical protein